MNTCTTCRRLSVDISYDRPFYDERLSYIESVCSALIESRFGAARHYQQLRTLNREPGSAVPVIRYLTGGGLVPGWGIAPSPSALKRLIDAGREASRRSASLSPEPPVEVPPVPSDALLPANALGRGSPANGPPQTAFIDSVKRAEHAKYR